MKPVAGDTFSYYFSKPAFPQDSGYIFRYTATDTAGCSNYGFDTISVYRPKVDFMVDRRATCDGDLNYFEASVLDTTAAMPLLYRWEFGDGNVTQIDSQTTFHTYQNDSLYAMRLIAFDAHGCSDTVNGNLQIDVRNVKAEFSVSDTFKLCPPLVATFTDKSEDSYNGIVNWEWTLGDGTAGNSMKPVKAYLEPGIFDVSLKVTDSLGCTDSLYKSAYIEIQGTKVTYTIDTNFGCEPLSVNVSATALGNAEIFWNMRDGSGIIDSAAFTHTYPKKGKYLPSVFVKDQKGCQYVLSVEDSIEVVASPIADFTHPVVCLGDSMIFTNTSESFGDTLQYSWYFNAVDSSNLENPSYLFSSSGSKSVSLRVRTLQGCGSSITQDVLISDTKASLKFSVPVSCVADSVSFQLNNEGIGKINQVTWYPGDGSKFITMDSSLRHAYLTKGYYKPWLHYSNEYGCLDTILPGDSILIGDNFAPVISEVYRTSVEDNNRTSLWFKPNTSIDFSRYIIERDAGGGFVAIATKTNWRDTTHIDLVPTLHDTYTYRVVTRNICGYSTDVNALVPHTTMELEASPAPDAAFLKWTPYQGWTPERYEIWRAETGKAFQKIKEVPGSVNSTFDSMIVCNVPYYYQIKAVGNGVHQTSYSDTSGALPNYIPFVYPNELYSASVMGNNKNLIIWSLSKNAKSPVAEYILERSTDGVDYFEAGRFDSFTDAHYDKVDSASRTSFYYRTIVRDSCGYYSEPSNYGKTMLITVGLDTAERPELSWMPYEYWEEGVDFYDIEIFKDGEFVYLATTDGQTLRYVDNLTPLNDQPNYCYRITARSVEDGGKRAHSSIGCAPVRSRIFIPNAFRPSGGLEENSTFYPKGMYIADFQMDIYDRWGKHVYSTNSMEEGWDGTIDGQPAPLGVYVYTIFYKGVDKTYERLSGSFLLLR
ncbi:MAG: PKD domain-containing protein [Bacteroidota bacterium]|nr:PKD domain-containing protein [Bacteroidota bacterium]MDX5430251.1 PKD domain-containing protein [Bacteroidota bacterium]MDX5469012.1 PKD domain-containing protein [Bacteroidota bacterium]